MKEVNAQSILSGAAVGVCILGLLMTVQSVRATPQAMAQLKRQSADCGKLLAFAAQEQRHIAAEQVFQKMDQKQAVPLADLVRSALPDVHVDIRPRDAKPLADGWSLRSADVTMDDIDFAAAGKLLVEAARVRPPWRVAECSVTAAGGSGAGSPKRGAGRVSLLMETIEESGK